MKERFRTWLDKPYTRKDIVKNCIFSMILYVIFMTIYWVWLCSDCIKDKIDWVCDRFRRIKTKKIDID